MADLESFSSELEEWRSNPVTERLRKAMELQVERRKESMCAAYLAGNSAPEEDRKALLMLEAWADDFFYSSAEDVEAAEDE